MLGLEESRLGHHNLRGLGLELLDHVGVVLVRGGRLTGLQTGDGLGLLAAVHPLGEMYELRVAVRQEVPLAVEHLKATQMIILYS